MVKDQNISLLLIFTVSSYLTENRMGSLWEVNAVCCKNHTEYPSKLCGEIVGFVSIKASCRC